MQMYEASDIPCLKVSVKVQLRYCHLYAHLQGRYFPCCRLVREHPVTWRVPTRILYGERDELTDMRTITEFAEKSGAALTVMPGGEHWFHTDEQLRFLDRWISA